MRKLAPLRSYVDKIRASRQWVVAVVTIVLLLDNMLMTVVVPILPSLLKELHSESNSNSTTDDYSDTGAIGILLSSKAIGQLLMNPFVGMLTNKIGYNLPLSVGFFLLVSSTLVFAFARSYMILIVARVVQGFGSSFSNVAGCGLLAMKFPDDNERSKAMSLALGGLALGVLIGPTFGGFMYQYVGKSSPFLVLAGLTLFDGLIQLLTLEMKIQKPEEKPKSIKSLMMDPYIVLAAVSLAMSNGAIGMIEAAVPNWMMERMGSHESEQGLAFLPCSLLYLVGSHLMGRLGNRVERWLSIILGLVVIGGSCIVVPFTNNFFILLVPLGFLGFAVGLVDATAMPELGRLVDIRHTSVYGAVYAIGDFFLCLGYALTSAISSTLVDKVGFDVVMYATGLLMIIYAPAIWFLKNPPVIRTDLEGRRPEEKNGQVNEAMEHDDTKPNSNSNDVALKAEIVKNIQESSKL